MVTAIDAAVQEWQLKTCVTFEKHQPTEAFTTQYLRFVDGNGLVKLLLLHLFDQSWINSQILN